jgi:preprotein translocase subunit YajC
MDGLGSLIILALVLVAFYFMAVRPQNKRMQQQRQMQSSIQLGDEVLTAGGLVVTVTSLGEDVITVELSEGVEVRLNRRFIVSKQESEADIAVINGDETGETELK